MTAEAIGQATTRPWHIMDVCGGQTHSIIRIALDEMLPGQLTLIHGPGRPVCVTPIEIIDKPIAIGSMPEIVFCSFGDMLRVPGSQKDLFTVKSEVTERHPGLVELRSPRGGGRIVDLLSGKQMPRIC